MRIHIRSTSLQESHEYLNSAHSHYIYLLVREPWQLANAPLLQLPSVVSYWWGLPSQGQLLLWLAAAPLPCCLPTRHSTGVCGPSHCVGWCHTLQTEGPVCVWRGGGEVWSKSWLRINNGDNCTRTMLVYLYIGKILVYSVTIKLKLVFKLLVCRRP